MVSEAQLRDATGRLRAIMAHAESNDIYQTILQARDEVLARFGTAFSPAEVGEIAESEVRAFLRGDTNKHWSGLHRMGKYICADMVALRFALAHLVDEGQPLSARLTGCVNAVKGLGKGIATAMLLVVYPEKYGVWNSTSESALRELGVWPDFARGISLGERYVQANEVLVRLANDLGIDLWALDGLLWFVLQETEDDGDAMPPEPTPEECHVFGLERHLQAFLLDNWEHTELGQEWDLYSEEGDPQAGYEYPTDVGRIDLLARHKTQPIWLVIELKRGQTADATLGQVLRYMGWIRRHKAEQGEQVQGLIIAREPDKGLGYALEVAKDVTVRVYSVSFSLAVPQREPWEAKDA
jgi:hypothetical protein